MNVTAFTDLLQQQFFAKRSNATKIVYKKVQNNCNAQPTLAPFYTQAGVFLLISRSEMQSIRKIYWQQKAHDGVLRSIIVWIRGLLRHQHFYNVEGRDQSTTLLSADELKNVN